MFKCSHRVLIIISGCVWLCVGIFLLSLGLHFILDTLQYKTFYQDRFSLIAVLSPFVGNLQETALTLITLCLVVGYIKGRFVLAKSVKRQVLRILSLPNPTPLKYIYSKAYYILLGSMIGLGILMRFLPISLDTRGAVDLAIGAALINGALLYFRFATTSYASLAKLSEDKSR